MASQRQVKARYLWVRGSSGDLHLCLECVCGTYTFDVPTTGFSCPSCGAAYAPLKEERP